MSRLDHMRRLIQEDGDTKEAQWYEPWDLVLNWLRVCTDLRLTIAPQFTVSRPYYDDGMYQISYVCKPISDVNNRRGRRLQYDSE